MIYLYALAFAVACFLVCFVTARVQAIVLFYCFRAGGLRSDADRDVFIRRYVRLLHMFGAVYVVVLGYVLIRRWIG
jgi:hypothetical protein